ncbi:hypothetical protein KCU67_g2765, partial [Aureobasidium melanogenum]
MSIKKGNMGGTRRSPRGGWRDAINRIEHRAMRVAFAPSLPATTTIEPQAPVDFSFGPPSPPSSPPPLSLLAARFCADTLLLPWDGGILLLLPPPLALAPPTSLVGLCLLFRCHHEMSKQREEARSEGR